MSKRTEHPLGYRMLRGTDWLVTSPDHHISVRLYPSGYYVHCTECHGIGTGLAWPPTKWPNVAAFDHLM